MIDPPPAARRCGMPCLVTQKTDFRLIAITRSHQPSSVSPIRAPWAAKRRAASRPMPMPAPVMSATRPASRGPSPIGSPLMSVPSRATSQPLEAARQLPAGHRLVERLLLEVGRVEVVLHHLRPEGVARQPGRLEGGDGLAERLRDLRELRVLVGVPLVD